MALKILHYMLAIEIVGAAILAIKLIPKYGAMGVAYSILYSISAFCNLGIDFIHSININDIISDPFISTTLMCLTIVGGLGFYVIMDIQKNKKWRKINLHSKMVIISSVLLVGIGGLVFYILESTNDKTLGSMNLAHRFLYSIFASSNFRSSGFSVLNPLHLKQETKLFTTILMFIGGSPSSISGGIKTTTFATIILMVISVIRGKKNVIINKRSVSQGTIIKSLSICIISFSIIFLSIIIVSYAESRNISNSILASLENVIFDVVSAFGTVGLTTGLASNFTLISKFIFIMLMFFGQIGPLSVVMSLSGSPSTTQNKISYPDSRIIVG